MIKQLFYQQDIPAPLSEVWDYFATPHNLNNLTPPNMDFQIIKGGDTTMYHGQLIEYRVKILPFVKSLWLTEIAHVETNRYFIDEQRIGPYQFWYHEHYFEEIPSGTRMTDTVTYQLPFGPLGDLAHFLWIGPRLRTIFNYRAQQIRTQFGSENLRDKK
jgi:ligand-binding SRPBCC domain-containing protein